MVRADGLGRGLCAVDKGRGAGERVHEGVPALRDLLGEVRAGFHRDVVQHDGRVREVVGGLDAVAAARNHLDADAAVVGGRGRDLRGPQVAVAWFARFQVLGQVDPQLHSHVRRAVGVLPRHLRVHYPPSGCHELQVAGADGALVSGEVFMVDRAGEEVGYCFLPAMGVVGESGTRVDREVVEHEEG